MCTKSFWNILLLHILVVCAQLCWAASIGAGGCEKSGVCTCVFDNGAVIDLSGLGEDGGLPLIYNVQVDEYAYSFSPCYPFTDVYCVDVLGCQANPSDQLYFPIGDVNNASFSYTDDILTGVYTSTDANYGTTRTSVVSYICDPSAESPEIEVLGEGPETIYKFTIRSVHACVKGLTTVTPAPTARPLTAKPGYIDCLYYIVAMKQQMALTDFGVETVKSFLGNSSRMLGPRIMKVDRTVGHDQQMISIDYGIKRCHTSYGEFTKRCEVEFDGQEQPVKILIVRDWNGICKFPTSKDVAVVLYSESLDCADVTIRCNPVQAFSVNGEVCKEVD